jgi:ADP-heptose:LPS heptosyltransferase
LTDALDYDPRAHAADNIGRLLDMAFSGSAGDRHSAPPRTRLRIPDEARREAHRLLGGDADRRMRIGVHVSGGRPVKQWAPERFAETATRLAREHGAAIVLTGTADDRALTDRVAALMPPDVRTLNLAGAMTLPVFGGLLESVNLLVTGDTGPMHLAAAVGTPLVAIFGPSDPDRYGPLSTRARIVTADLWCRPCNRVRLPPARCSHGTPDCLDLVSVEMVVDAARAVLEDTPNAGSGL